jgi:hypothetical protein
VIFVLRGRPRDHVPRPATALGYVRPCGANGLIWASLAPLSNRRWPLPSARWPESRRTQQRIKPHLFQLGVSVMPDISTLKMPNRAKTKLYPSPGAAGRARDRSPVAMKFMFVIWGGLGLLANIVTFLSLFASNSVVTSAYVSGMALIWIGGMVFFGLGGLLFKKDPDDAGGINISGE